MARLKELAVRSARAVNSDAQSFEEVAQMTLRAYELGQVVEIRRGFISFLRCNLSQTPDFERGDLASIMATPTDTMSTGPVAFIADLFSCSWGAACKGLAEIASLPGVEFVAGRYQADGKWRVIPAGLIRDIWASGRVTSLRAGYREVDKVLDNAAH